MNDCDQICLNTDGSYTCSCRDGFILDNDRRSCLGKCNMFMHSCASYLWEFVTLHTVLGTNRCPDDNACSDICTLVNDDPTCDCSPGYMLQSDGQSCEGAYVCICDHVTFWAITANYKIQLVHKYIHSLFESSSQISMSAPCTRAFVSTTALTQWDHTIVHADLDMYCPVTGEPALVSTK